MFDSFKYSDSVNFAPDLGGLVHRDTSEPDASLTHYRYYAEFVAECKDFSFCKWRFCGFGRIFATLGDLRKRRLEVVKLRWKCKKLDIERIWA